MQCILNTNSSYSYGYGTSVQVGSGYLVLISDVRNSGYWKSCFNMNMKKGTRGGKTKYVKDVSSLQHFPDKTSAYLRWGRKSKLGVGRLGSSLECVIRLTQPNLPRRTTKLLHFLIDTFINSSTFYS